MKNYYSVLFFLFFALSACASTPISPFQPPSEDKPHAEIHVTMTEQGLFRQDVRTMSMININGQAIDGNGEAWKLQPYSSSVISIGDSFIEVHIPNSGYGYVHFYAEKGENYTISSQQKPHHRFNLTVTDSQQHQIDTRSFGSNYSPTSYENETLLDAIAANDAKKVEHLLRAGSDPNGHGNRLDPISLAALENNLEITLLLIAAGADVDTPQGVKALRRAAKNGNLEIAQVLLDHGADINLRGFYLENGVLMEAAQNGHLKMVEFLLQHGAYIKFRNHEGKTASDLAKEAGYQKISDLMSHHVN